MGRGGLITFRGCFFHTTGHICTNLMLKRFNSMSHIDNQSQNSFKSFLQLAPSCAVMRHVLRRLFQVKPMLAPSFMIYHRKCLSLKLTTHLCKLQHKEKRRCAENFISLRSSFLKNTAQA